MTNAEVSNERDNAALRDVLACYDEARMRVELELIERRGEERQQVRTPVDPGRSWLERVSLARRRLMGGCGGARVIEILEHRQQAALERRDDGVPFDA